MPPPPSDGGLTAAQQADMDRRVLESALFYGLGVFAALLVMLAAVVTDVSALELQMIGLALVILLVALVPAAIAHARPPEQRHLLLTIFSLAYVCFYSIPIFTQYFFGDQFDESSTRLINIAPPDILIGQGLALVALLCVYFGYFYPAGRFLGGVFPKPTAEWTHPTALSIALLMIFLGWTVFFGSILGLIPRRAGSGVLGVIGSSVYYGIGLLAIIHIRYRSQPALALMWLLVPITVAFAFLTGSKRFALSPLVAIVIAYIVIERRIRFIWVAGGLIALTLLYPIAQFWREVSWGGSLSLIQWILSPVQVITTLASFLAASDFGEYFRIGLVAVGHRLDLLGITSVIVRDTPSVVPFQGGWTLAYIPISFIPRILWPGKPQLGAGQWVTDNYGSGPHITSSTGSGWVGELYFNFGLIGVIIGMVIIGAIFRILHETLFRSDATIPALLASMVVLFTTCPTIEMNLLAPLSGGVFHLAPILLTHMVIRSAVGTTIPAVHQARTPPPRAA